MSKPVLIVTCCIIAGLLLLPLIAAQLNGDGTATAGDAATTAVSPAPPPAASPAPPPPTYTPPPPAPGTPVIVFMDPPNGATNVSPQVAYLTVMFSEPMGGGFSWTGGGPNFPEGAGRPYWAADRKTCVFPVRLRPNWSYRLGLNSKSHQNFRSASGTPLTPVVWEFKTGG